MTGELGKLLKNLTPLSGEELTWAGGMRLRVNVYVTSALPDLSYVTSVRTILLTDAGCAFLTNADGTHVIPGGRRRPSEAIRDTLRREIREETGCVITTSKQLGFLHFRHLTPKPVDYAYPYPDFVHALFAARGVPSSDFHGDPDGYETTLGFVPFSELGRLDIPSYQRVLVDAALQELAKSG